MPILTCDTTGSVFACWNFVHTHHVFDRLPAPRFATLEKRKSVDIGSSPCYKREEMQVGKGKLQRNWRRKRNLTTCSCVHSFIQTLCVTENIAAALSWPTTFSLVSPLLRKLHCKHDLQQLLVHKISKISWNANRHQDSVKCSTKCWSLPT